ncbi:MAG: 16S rRNA (cytidine(1402)-2'-O)-methyltransferase [Bacilli bacterium]|nr:16S rRNA (cytidine(1402)-2'-O)-methyltransferase [Bacilli bacterium]
MKKDNSLYLIPTPIGNLDDITIRSLNTLKLVDAILCEDTRETSKLLKKYEISKKLISCHEYNEKQIKDKVVSMLKEGKNLGLVTDQGTPIISDPGFVIVKEVIDNNLNVIPLPGATAFVPALISSGISPAPFLFYGFLNSKGPKQKKELEKLKSYTDTLIFYEAPHRIVKTLTNMLDIFGDRNISIHREISKMYEEIIRGKISDLIKKCDNIKGEIVLVVEGNKEKVDYSNLSIVEHVNLYVDDGMDVKEAIKLVSKEREIAKSIVYKEYHVDK